MSNFLKKYFVLITILFLLLLALSAWKPEYERYSREEYKKWYMRQTGQEPP